MLEEKPQVSEAYLAHQMPTVQCQSWPTTRLLPIATAANEMGWTEMAPAEKGGVTATRERVRNTHTRHNESKEIRRY